MSYVQHLGGLPANSTADMDDFVNTHKVVARRDSVSAFFQVHKMEVDHEKK